MGEVIEVLREGYIPVLQVTVSDDPHTKPRFTVGKADDKMSYIAISHVWADGLGNPKANAIPLCQLKVLCRTLQNSTDDKGQNLSFWLDTLCISVDKSLADLRNFSI